MRPGGTALKARHLILLLLFGAIAAQCVYYYPLLPEMVASHYGTGGRPNGWSSRTGFYAIYLGMVTVMPPAFFVLPILLRKFQVQQINIPNRHYWLAPERREQAYAMLANEMAWFGNVILGFLLGMMQLVFEANVAAEAGQRRLPEAQFLTLLGIFLAFVVFWIVRLYRRFAKPSP